LKCPRSTAARKLEVPAGTQSGAVFRLRGRGMPDARYRATATCWCRFYIEVPKKLNADHRRILRELAEVEEVHVYARPQEFF